MLWKVPVGSDEVWSVASAQESLQMPVGWTVLWFLGPYFLLHLGRRHTTETCSQRLLHGLALEEWKQRVTQSRGQMSHLPFQSSLGPAGAPTGESSLQAVSHRHIM